MLLTPAFAFPVSNPFRLEPRKDSKSGFFCQPKLWRNAGVVAGNLAATLRRSAPADNPAQFVEAIANATRATEDMFRYWARFVDETVAHGWMEKEGESIADILALLRDAVNPFLGKREDVPWLDQWRSERGHLLDSIAPGPPKENRASTKEGHGRESASSQPKKKPKRKKAKQRQGE